MPLLDQNFKRQSYQIRLSLKLLSHIPLMHFLLNAEECIKVSLPTRVTHVFLKKSVRVVQVRSSFLGALFEFVALYDLTPLLSTVNSLSIGRCSLSISSDAYLIMVKR